MGIFDLLRRKSKRSEPTAGEQPEPTERRGPRASWRCHDSSVDDRHKELLSNALERDVAPHFESWRLKDVEEPLPSIELRGQFLEKPAKVAVVRPFAGLYVAFKIENRTGRLDLKRNPDMVPKEKQPVDPWSDEDEVRVFVGEAVFVEGKDEVVAEKLAAFRRLPAELRSEIASEMQRWRLSAVVANQDELRLVLHKLDDAGDRGEEILGSLRFGAKVADVLAAGEQEPIAETTTGEALIQRVSCSYCGTSFVLALNHTCPNCGAPYSTS